MLRKSRVMTLMLMGICLMISLTAALVVKAGAIPGISPEIDANKEAAKERALNQVTITGAITDCNGIKLAWNDAINDDRKYVDPYIYSSLFAFETGGLQYIYHDELYSHGDTEYEDEKGESYYRGSNICLTLDNELQRKAYGYIKDIDDASAVILDDTGAVKSMVSSRPFNINDITENYNELAAIEGMLLNPAKDYLTPCGSVLKPVIAQTMTDYGYNESFVVEDQGKISINGAVIANASGKSYGKIMMHRALVKSSNVYFISAAEHIGKSVMKARYDEFGIGSEIETDFGAVSSRVADIHNDFDLAMSAIGQNVSLSTVHLAMIMQGVTTGKIMQPYMVNSVEKDGHRGKKTEPQILSSSSVSESSILHVNTILKDCGESYGLDEETVGTAVMAKTGTSEIDTADDGKHVATMMIAWPANDPEYFMAIQARNTDKFGRQLAPIAVELIKAVEN